MANCEPLPRVRGVSRAEFKEKFLDQQQAVILEGMIEDWPAYQTWTPDYFKAEFGNVVCHASLDLPSTAAVGEMHWDDFTRWMTVAEFVDYMRAAEKPCYMQQVPKRLFENVDNSFDFARLADLTGGNVYINIFLGSGNTNSSLHYDMPNNFLAQVYGAKQAIMFAPDQRRYINTFPDSLRMSAIDPYAPDLRCYPRFAHARGFAGVIKAGDVLFIPRVWWHQLRSLNESISINCWFGREQSAAYFLRVAAIGGPLHFAVPVKDFLVHGLLHRPHANRLFGDIPTGLWVYDQLVNGLRRKLGAVAASADGPEGSSSAMP